jgi:hypothetical protein
MFKPRNQRSTPGAQDSKLFNSPFRMECRQGFYRAEGSAPVMESDLSATTSYTPGATDFAGLDNLLHSKSRILRTKLEVLASEIQARFALWDRNLERLDRDKDAVETLLDQSTRLARYHLRDQREVGRVRDSALRLDTQRRDEDIQCWRDVVLVMRDFLDAWEAHEQAKSRAIFINHAGARTEESV